MLRLDGPLDLFHGSNVEVSKPDLALCAPRKDFGRGFYLTSSKEQAESFARTVTRRSNRRDPMAAREFGFVSRYRFTPSSQLRVVAFESADADWLHCIVAHRKGKPFAALLDELASADVITGKVANDQTNATLLAYIGGLYGEIGSERADSTCIGLLIPERLHDQAAFRSEGSLRCLEYLGSERVWL